MDSTCSDELCFALYTFCPPAESVTPTPNVVNIPMTADEEGQAPHTVCHFYLSLGLAVSSPGATVA